MYYTAYTVYIATSRHRKLIVGYGSACCPIRNARAGTYLKHISMYIIEFTFRIACSGATMCALGVNLPRSTDHSEAIAFELFTPANFTSLILRARVSSRRGARVARKFAPLSAGSRSPLRTPGHRFDLYRRESPSLSAAAKGAARSAGPFVLERRKRRRRSVSIRPPQYSRYYYLVTKPQARATVQSVA